MEYDSGAPYYRAKVTGNPNLTTDGTVIVRVEYCEKQGTTIARFHSDGEKALKLKVGDTLYVCPCDGDAHFDDKCRLQKC